ncbi:serine/threonine-protein kinase SAPK7 isoform X2 [Cicer arietinum]|uniref:serine/threonine-protein kinase SAPK7 isoform X2 n=1 Tax=Cicer arietinum TaxID=3827 RepID=UPI003CC60DD9
MENYEEVKNIGDGNFAIVKLLRHKETKALFAVKYISRDQTVILTPTHIAIVMEYAANGDLFDYVCNQGKLSEDEARYFFQQLISGVSHCHDMEICHRDLKFENTLLDGRRIKICDFGYSKSRLLHSRPNSRIGTLSYIAPEIFSCKEYDGKLADVWSCGVILYIMLVGELPFGDQKDLKNPQKTVNQIMLAQYKIPNTIHISQDCRNLISRIFVANPVKRITMREIKSHAWFLKDLPKESTKGGQDVYYSSLQTIEEIMNILDEAKNLPETSSRDQLEDLAEALKKM